MRTGVAYMGHHNPKHLENDIHEMNSLQLDDINVPQSKGGVRSK